MAATKKRTNESSKMSAKTKTILIGFSIFCALSVLICVSFIIGKETTHHYKKSRVSSTSVEEIYKKLQKQYDDLLNTTISTNTRVTDIDLRTTVLEAQMVKVTNRLNKIPQKSLENSNTSPIKHGVGYRCHHNQFAVQLVTYTKLYHALKFQEIEALRLPNTWIQQQNKTNTTYYFVRSQCYDTRAEATELAKSVRAHLLPDAYVINF